MNGRNKFADFPIIHPFESKFSQMLVWLENVVHETVKYSYRLRVLARNGNGIERTTEIVVDKGSSG